MAAQGFLCSAPRNRAGNPEALQGPRRANLTPSPCLGACRPLPSTAGAIPHSHLAALGHRHHVLLAFANEMEEESWGLLRGTASEGSCPPRGRQQLPWSGPGRGLVRGKEPGRAAQRPSSRQAGLPVDGIVHDEHFVLIPSPFFFLQGKKLKMSTSDAVLEIKDRAETSGDRVGKLLAELCCSPGILHQGPGPAGDQQCPTSPPMGTP